MWGAEHVLEMPNAGKTEMNHHLRGAAQADDLAAARVDGALDDRWAAFASLVHGRYRRASGERDQSRGCAGSRPKSRGRRQRGALLLLVLFGALGCGSARPPAASGDEPGAKRAERYSNPTGAYTEQTFSLRNGWIRGTLMIPAGAGRKSPRAVVINPVVDPAPLLERGIVVARYSPHWGSLPRPVVPAAPEPKHAGDEQVGVWLLASPSPRVIGESYFRLITVSGEAAAEVVAYLVGLDFVDAERIGMAGISTNGFKVYSALMAGVPLRAAVIVGACGDYHAFLRDSPVALAGAALDLDPDYDGWLQEREPIRHPARLVGAAVLLVNGGRDHVIPTPCVQGASPILRAAFEEHGVEGKFHQSWMPEATHNDLVERATSEILAWWERWLL